VAILADPSLPAVRDDWSRLAEEHGSVFATPEWLLTWWKHFGAGRELLLSVEDDAVLPFYGSSASSGTARVTSSARSGRLRTTDSANSSRPSATTCSCASSSRGRTRGFRRSPAESS
jgi:hypothetical protein